MGSNYSIWGGVVIGVWSLRVRSFEIFNSESVNTSLTGLVHNLGVLVESWLLLEEWVAAMG